MQNVEKLDRSWLDRMNEEDTSADDYLSDDSVAKGNEKVYLDSYLQLIWWRFL